LRVAGAEDSSPAVAGISSWRAEASLANTVLSISLRTVAGRGLPGAEAAAVTGLAALQAKISYHLVPTLVQSFALSVALSGTAVAATKINGKILKNRSVPAANIKVNSLTGTEIRAMRKERSHTSNNRKIRTTATENPRIWEVMT
jgi:hypothetical protein